MVGGEEGAEEEEERGELSRKISGYIGDPHFRQDRIRHPGGRFCPLPEFSIAQKWRQSSTPNFQYLIYLYFRFVSQNFRKLCSEVFDKMK